MMGGSCRGQAFVEDVWYRNIGCGDCRECTFLTEDDGLPGCQVNYGSEPYHLCPLLVEFITRNEIKLYGWRYL